MIPLKKYAIIINSEDNTSAWTYDIRYYDQTRYIKVKKSIKLGLIIQDTSP